jgi:hypothetical protein
MAKRFAALLLILGLLGFPALALAESTAEQ